MMIREECCIETVGTRGSPKEEIVKRLGLGIVFGLILAVAMAACGEATPETVIVEKEVIREVPVEVVVKEEVIKEVQVPGETVIVTKEVVKEVMVKGETVVVTKEVPVEVVKEVVTFKTTEVIKEIPAPNKFGESPKMATLVRQGRLPPVEERLPVDPMVIGVVENIGEYGGEIKRSYLGSNLSCNFGRPIRDGLVRPSMDGNSIVMAVAKSISSTADQKTWTVKLRTGMKWSDGMPFSADDFAFQHERMSDDELTPVKAAYFSGLAGGGRVDVKKIDDITVEFKYDVPNSIFLDTGLVMDADCGRVRREYRIQYAPAHYMKQFFPKYADGGKAAIEKMAKDGGFTDWMAFYRNQDTTQENPDRPTTRFLILDSPSNQKRIIGNRNPYFYAVDPVGNQLPYIDRWIWDPVSDREAVNLNAVGGLIDFQSRHISLTDVPLFRQHEEKAGFRVVLWDSLEENDVAIAINHSDASEKGEYFRNADFRHALSYAIDRDTINEVVFLGLGEARNLMPPTGHPYYPGPEFEYKYMEFDLAKANMMLDEIMPNKDDNGFRKMASGEVMDIHLYGGQFADTIELLGSQLARAGIKTTLQINVGAASSEAYRSNTRDTAVSHHVASGLIFSYPDKLIPLLDQNCSWCAAYGYYTQSGGEVGIKPPPEIQQLIDWYKSGSSLADKERFEVGKNIYRQHAKEQYIINVIAHSPFTQGTIIVNSKLRNVPEQAANSWPHRAESTGYPSQFYYGQ